MNRELHLIIRLSDDGKAYATSPQAPGLMLGRQSLKELRYDLDDVLSFHFDDPGPFDVHEHIERHYNLPEGELVIRVAQDAHASQRETVAERIRQVATIREQAQGLVSTVNAVGEAVYVCAVPSDELGWLATQLQPRETVNAALTIAEGFLFTLPVAADQSDRPAWTVGAASATTHLSEIMQRTPVVTPQQLLTLEPC